MKIYVTKINETKLRKELIKKRIKRIFIKYFYSFFAIERNNIQVMKLNRKIKY